MDYRPPGSSVPLSKEFSRQEYWNGLLFPTLGDLPNKHVSFCLLQIDRQILHHSATWEAPYLSKNDK